MFRYVILGLLRNGAVRHGYALVKTYQERSGGDLRSGSIYRELRRLADEGLIRGAMKSAGDDGRRLPYEITDRGRLAFDEWFMKPSVAAGISGEDDLSTRVLFLFEHEPSLAAAALERIRVTRSMWGQRLERERRSAVRAGQERTVLLPLLTRRLKQAAADLELIDELSALLGDHASRGASAAPVALAARRAG